VPRRPPFAGRRRELDELQQLRLRAAAGEGALCLLSGDPGIGKTRLAEELTAAQPGGALVLWGRCVDSPAAPPYLPWVQAVRELRRSTGADHFATLAGAGLPSLLQAMPELADPVAATRSTAPRRPDDAESSRYALFEAMAATLRAAAAEQPLLIVLDDLHWADEPSLQLLAWLVPELPRTAALLLATYRDADLPADHALRRLEQDAPRGALARLRLGGLDTPDLAALVRAAGMEDAGDDVAAHLHDHTGGNPFFTIETLRLLAADPASRSWTSAVPDSVADVLGRRLGSLSAGCRALLEAAAVAADFSLDLLQSATAEPRAHLLDHVDEAVAAGLVVDHHGARDFAHGLVRETVLRGVPRARAARLHGAVAAALEARAGDLTAAATELARHHAAAMEADDAHRPAAHRWAVIAAQRATARLAHEEAVRLLTLALDTAEPGDLRSRAALLLDLGDARRRAGDVLGCLDAAEQAMETAATLDDGDLRARAALLSRGVSGHRVGARVVALCRAAAAHPARDPALRVRVLSRLAQEQLEGFPSGPPDEGRAREESAEVLRLAEQVGDPAALFDAFNARQMALSGPADVEERLALAERTLELGRRTGHPEVLIWGHTWRSDALFQLCRVDEAEADLERSAEIAEMQRDPLGRWRVLMARGAFATLRGDLVAARRLSDEALELGRRGNNPAAAYLHQFQLMQLAVLVGGVEEIEPAFRAMGGAPGMFSIHARLLAAMGRVDEARTVLTRGAAASGDAIGPAPRPVWLLAAAGAADTVTAVGARELAEPLLDRLMPFLHHNVAAGAGQQTALGAVARFTGRLATTLERWPQAEEHLGIAIELNTAMGARPHLALAQLDMATMLVRRSRSGDAQRAVSVLAECVPALRALGMAAAVEAEELHRDLSGRGVADHPLSRRELEVARMVAVGMSNREIAERLVLAQRTAESHVKNICDKLGFNRRSQIAAWVAAREGAGD
jgi:DNA-binding CsgD family transcriptional regulator